MKGGSYHKAIRRVLRENPDGLTTKELFDLIVPHIDRTVLGTALRNMPDTYVDRWQYIKGSPPSAVWIAVVPPEDAPKPDKRKDDEPRKR
jgi:hypothetical protein